MGFFIRFAEVLVRCLCFHFFTYVVHTVSENHFKLGTWAVTNKDSIPSLLSAFREQQGGKEKGKVCGGYSPPRPQLGPEGPRPHEWVHCMLDTTEPGQLLYFSPWESPDRS